MPVTAAELQVLVKTVGAAQASGELRNFGAQVDSVGTKAGRASGQLRDTQGRFASVGDAADGAGRKMGKAGKSAGIFNTILGDMDAKSVLASAGLAGVGLQAFDLGKAAVGAAIDWETAFAGVRKTVEATDAELEVLEQGIRDMATEMPIAATELAAIAEAAGALGVAKQDIIAFTEVAAQIGITTDVSSDQAATALGQLSNVLGLTTEDYERFGSTLVDLGNKGASTESQILDITSRAGAAGELIGFATQETLAWSAAVANLGIQAEAGGSSLQRFFVDSASHVAAMGEELAIMAETAGMTADAFKQAFEQDSSAALQTFIDGLGELAQAEQLAVLEALGFSDVRITRTLLGLASNTDNLTNSLNVSEEAWRANNAMQIEAEKRFETTASEIQIVKNQLQELNLTLAEGYLPLVGDSISVTSVWVEFVTDASEELVLLNDNLGMVIGAIRDYIPEVEVAGQSTGDWALSLRDAALSVTPIIGPVKALNDLFGLLGGETDASTQATKANKEEVAAWGEQITYAIFGLSDATEAQIEFTREQHRGRQAAAQYGVEINNLSDVALRGYISSSQQAHDATRRVNMEFDASVAAMDRTTEQWDRRIDAMTDIFQRAPESASQVVDDLVLAFQSGRIDLDEIMGLIGRLPEDVIYEHILPAFDDLRTDWQTTVAELGDAPEAEAGLRSLDTIMQALGVTFDRTNEKIGITSANLQDLFQHNIENAAGKVSEWEANLSGAETALGFLNDQIDAGIPLTDEQQAQYDTLIWASERYAGGVEDEAEALIAAEVAKANYIRVTDEINQGLKDETLTQEEANRMRDEAIAQLDPATQMTLENADAQNTLADSLDRSTDKMALLLYYSGQISETEAEMIIGADIEDAERDLGKVAEMGMGLTEGPYGMVVTVDDLDATANIAGLQTSANDLVNNSPYGMGFTADTTAASTAVSGLKSDIDAVPKSFTVTAYFDPNPAKVGFTDFADHIPHSPAKKGPLAFTPNWDWLFEGLEASADHYTDETLAHIRSYVDTANAAFGALDSSLSFATTSAEFQASGVALPDNDFLAHLNDFAGAVTFEVGTSAVKFEQQFLEAAERYSRAAQAGVGLLTEAVGFVASLEDVTVDLDRAFDAATDLKFITEHITFSIGDSAALISNERGEGFLEGAEQYAEGAGAAVGLIGQAASDLAGLDEFTIDLEAAEDAASDLKFLTEHTTLSVGDSAAQVASERPEGFVGAAGVYAEGAEKAVSLISAGMEFISQLAEFEGEFDLAAAEDAASDLKFLTEHIAVSVGDAAAALQSQRPEGFLAGMQAYAEAVGPGIELLADTLGFVTDLSSADLASFEVDVPALATTLSTVALDTATAVERASRTWNTETNPQIEAFAKDAGASLGLIGDAADAVEAILEFGEAENRPDVDRLSGALVGIAETVTAAVGAAATEFETDGLEATERFTEAAGPALAVIADAQDIALGMTDMERITDRDMDTFIDNWGVVIGAVEDIATMVETRGVEASDAILEDIQYIADVMNAAEDAISSVGGGGGGGGSSSGSTVGQVQTKAPLPQFASGTYTTGAGLAFLHSSEYVTPEASLDRLADKLAAQLGGALARVGGGGRPIILNLDGREIARWFIDQQSNQYQGAI